MLAKVFRPSCNQFRWQPISISDPWVSKDERAAEMGVNHILYQKFYCSFLSTVQIWLQFVKDCGFQAIQVSYVVY